MKSGHDLPLVFLGDDLELAVSMKETIAGLTAFTDDAESIVPCPRVFQVRGHKRAIEH